MTDRPNSTNQRRAKTPKLVAEEVMFRAQMQCCVCAERGDHIHHIDLNPRNNDIDNLVFLCFKDHNEASITSPLQRRLTPELLRKFRDDWYDKVKSDRHPKDDNVNHMSLGNDEARFQLTMDALIVLEVRKAFAHHFWDDWAKAEEVLSSLYIYVELAGSPARIAILEGLRSVSDGTRYWMPSQLARQISDLAFDFLPISSLRRKQESPFLDAHLELFRIGVEITEDLIYDGAVKLTDLGIVFQGSKLLWQIHLFARLNENKILIEMVEEKYNWLFDTLNRPGLNNAVRLLRLFFEHVSTGDAHLPQIPDELEDEVFHPKRRARHGS